MPVIACGDRQFTVTYSDDINSKYIKDVVELSNDMNIVMPVPDKYYTVIDNYVDHLVGNQTPITNKDRICLSFQLNTLFVDDDVYFKYCVQQVFSAALLSEAYLRFNNWSYMCNTIYNNFNDDLQWSFFVLAPYDFIPKRLLTNDIFMK